MMFLLLIFNEKEWNYNRPLMKEIRLNFDGERSCYYQILFGTRENSRSQRILLYLRVRPPFYVNPYSLKAFELLSLPHFRFGEYLLNQYQELIR